MPTLAFFPWAQLAEPVDVGRFSLIPMAVAEKSGAVPAKLVAAVHSVLAPYQARPNAKLDRVPLLHRIGTDVCGELDDDAAADLFAFRTRLAFAALASRDFFASSSYCNSDNFQLVAQGFSTDNAGATVIMSRRRDGSVRNMVSASSRHEQRPHHVSPPAMMPAAIDMPLLRSLEVVSGDSRPEWPRLEEAMALFVGANTDSRDVTVHGELVDLVSAFGRLADAWNQEETVAWFLNTLPGPSEKHLDLCGPKLALARLKLALTKTSSIRAAWLADAYVLRSQHAHGRVSTPPYHPIWTAREHLLLGAVVFPLTVKAVLARDRLYEWTRTDAMLDEAFDALATLEPFAPPAPHLDPEDDVDSYPWRDVITKIQFRHFVDQVSAGLPGETQQLEG